MTLRDRLVCAGHDLARWGLGILFLYAGSTKLREISRFTLHLADFGIVPDGLTTPVAWAICLLEIACGVGLLARLRIALYAMVMLLMALILVLAYGIAIGLDIECGCLGAGYSMKLQPQMLIDCGLLVVCYCVYRSWKPCRSKPSS